MLSYISESETLLAILPTRANMLQELLTTLSSILCNPFSTVQLQIVLTSLKALQTTMLTCWPRISEPHHYREVVQALSFCWISIESVKESDAEAVGFELRVCGKILQCCVSEIVDLDSELLPLFQVEPALELLFASQGRAIVGKAT